MKDHIKNSVEQITKGEWFVVGFAFGVLLSCIILLTAIIVIDGGRCFKNQPPIISTLTNGV